MYLVGLTGGIASGKSTVTKILKDEFGCPSIDADVIARQVVEPGQVAYNKVVETFGQEVLQENGQLNREKLGQIIFHDSNKRKQLNAIVHPAIKREMLWQIFLCLLRGYKFVILDVPLLFETKQMLPYVSYTVVVSCTEEQQLRRLMERNSLSIEDATARIKAQLPLSEKCKLGTYIIDNGRSLDETKEQVRTVYLKLSSSYKHLPLRLGLMVLIAAFVGGIVLLL